MDIARLKEKVERIEDPRRAWGNLRHKLEAILVIGLAALVCNGSDFEDRESFGVYREAELKKFLELPNGIPDESTLLRVFRRIRPEQMSIENRLYWSLDVVFREEAARVRKDYAPENLNILRKMALSLLRAAPLPEKHHSYDRPQAPLRCFPVSRLYVELVPKLIDYALKRMVLEQALAVFRPMAYKTAVFKGSCSKN